MAKKNTSKNIFSSVSSEQNLAAKAQQLEQSVMLNPPEVKAPVNLDFLIEKYSKQDDPSALENYLYYLTVSVKTRNSTEDQERLYSYLYRNMYKFLSSLDESGKKETADYETLMRLLRDIKPRYNGCEPLFIPSDLAAYICKVKQSSERSRSPSVKNRFKRNDLLLFFEFFLRQLACECVSEESYPYVKKYLFDCFEKVFASTQEEPSSVLLGVPENVAYRIGQAYLNGTDLPMNKQCAKEWFFYGMVCGDPRCTLAYILFFLNVSAGDSVQTGNNIALIYTLLVNSFMLCSHTESASLRDYLKLDSSDSLYYQEMTLCNLMSFFSTVYFDLDLEDMSITPLFKMIPDFYEEICSMLEKFPSSSRLRATIISCIQSFFDLSEDAANYSLILELMGGFSKKDTAAQAFARILEEGMSANCMLSCRAYERLHLEYIGPYEHIQEKYLKIMSKLGIAEATFYLGNISLPKKGEAYALKLWDKASSQGHGFGAFNCSLGALIKENHQKSVQYAQTAISRGIVFGYYMLYLNNVKSNKPLAHTYLKLASEYLFSDAVGEYRAVKSENLYQPLPYMQALEDLENMAVTNPHAALILSEIYVSSAILPYNAEKSLHYQKMAVANGLYSVFPMYKSLYQDVYSDFDSKYSFLDSYISGLDRTSSFFNGYHDSMLHPDLIKNASEKAREIILCLKDGKSELEKAVFYEVRRSKILTDIVFSDKEREEFSKCRYKPLYASVYDFCQALCRGEHNVPLEGQTDKDMMNSVIERCSFLENGEISDTAVGELAKAVISVRALFGRVNYAMYRHYLNLAVNSKNKTAMILDSIDFSSVCPNDEPFTESKIAEKADRDVFISTVAQ
ncbi:MAG: hypothetical protein ACI4UM_07080 [Succinivibrio sp.]